MARIFITGSSDGLGLLAAKKLIAGGHRVVLHSRNEQRKTDAAQRAPGAEHVLTADLSDLKQVINLAHEVNRLGAFDAVIHNAGVYQAPARQILAVNVLAPYVLTSLVSTPQKLIYLSSDMHLGGRPRMDLLTEHAAQINYSDSKLFVTMLCNAVARYRPGVFANAVNPGWVPTKMGGAGAPDNLVQGYETQVWLAASGSIETTVTGSYFYHQKIKQPHPATRDVQLQDELLKRCEQLTEVRFGR